MKPSLMQPAVMGGLVGGVLSALPIISAGNLCCCLWVISGGVVAAYVMQQNQPVPLTDGDGALVGLVAGIAGAVVYLVISIPINLFVAPMERLLLERLMQRIGNVPPEFRDYAMTSAAGGIFAAVGFLFMLVLGAVFSTLGGLLGAVIFRKKMPPGTVDVVPPASA